MSGRIHRFSVGGVEGAVIDVLEPDTYDLNRSLPEAHQRPGDATISYTWHCWYLHHAGRHIMVDAGYHAHEVIAGLAQLGVSPDAIELVLITHGDGDHIVGLRDADGTPAIPNARYVLSQQLWDFWHDDAALGARYEREEHRDLIRGIVEILRDRSDLYPGAAELPRGIELWPCPGHREGHITFRVPTDAEPLWFIGDAIFDPVFVEHPEWPDRSDNEPERAAESRRALLAEAASSGALLLTGHIPFPGIGHVELDSEAGGGASTDEAYRWIPVKENA